MKKWTLVLGGARSGKSRFALDEIKKTNGTEVVFLASGVATDNEMQERIKRHQQERSSHWKTVEAPYDVLDLLNDLGKKEQLILWDCVSFYLNNLIYREWDGIKIPVNQFEEKIHNQIDQIISLKPNMVASLWIVSNEVGGGLIPETPLGRLYRDLAGRVNQKLAAASDQVYLLTAGIPLKIK